ncbi:hypothetical protein GCM10007418_26140 [Halopseudomonas salina]|uniref:Uncharacterized protein n=1 Tax=Halopseudomonas salina TaxID=1323744 RepID=A0ABQ1PWJ2_9GAMM|nr:hypothetical protein GCM10007418_26140 [Halopseudomonas salina]
MITAGVKEAQAGALVGNPCELDLKYCAAACAGKVQLPCKRLLEGVLAK